MPTREELVRANVLNQIADDYEEIGQIQKQLAMWAADLKITRDEITAALSSTLELGWAKAYDLWVSQVPLEPNPDITRFNELYFWITPEGVEVLKNLPDEWIPEIPDA